MTHPLRALVAGLVGYEVTWQLQESDERWLWWRRAKAYCEVVKKPILRVGMRRGFLEPPNGDVTIDIDPAVKRVPGGIQGDVRKMPFTEKQFAVCFIEHVLEHLHSIEDVGASLREGQRVADRLIVLAPSPWSLVNRFHPDHHLDLYLRDGGVFVHERETGREGFASAEITIQNAVDYRLGKATGRTTPSALMPLGIGIVTGLLAFHGAPKRR